MIIIGTYLAYLGLLVFSFSLGKHFKEVFKKDLSNLVKYFAMILGTILLILSQVILIKSIGISLGITYLIGILAVIPCGIALIYTYKPTAIIRISGILFFLTLIGAIL